MKSLSAIDVRREKTRKASEARWRESDENRELETDSVTDTDDALRNPSRTSSRAPSSSSSSSSSQSVKSTESKATSKAFDFTPDAAKDSATAKQPQEQARQADAFSSLGDRTDEEQPQPQELHPCAVQGVENTIGVHFANCTDIIGKLTDGELDRDDYHCSDEFEDWEKLTLCASSSCGREVRPAVSRTADERVADARHDEAPEEAARTERARAVAANHGRDAGANDRTEGRESAEEGGGGERQSLFSAMKNSRSCVTPIECRVRVGHEAQPRPRNLLHARRQKSIRFHRFSALHSSWRLFPRANWKASLAQGRGEQLTL